MKNTAVKNRIKDPEIIFKNISGIIAEQIIEIEEKYNAGYNEIISFLKNNEPEIFKKIENHFKKIDSDIYKKYRNNTLKAQELDKWEKELKQWYISIKKGLNKFTNFKNTIIN